ncbi:MAG: PIN domain-containing protein [Treponema sp.]|nr:PIN domain-containing protein [Treponema sp.]
MIYVLDACALIALFNIEPGAQKVRELLLRAATGEITVYINAVNLLEVYYDRIRIEGLEKAEQILQWVYSSAVEVLEIIPAPVIREAGRFKAAYDMSLADSLACATSSWLSAVLVSSDHGELDAVEKDGGLKFLWIR